MADLYGPIQSRINSAASWASGNPVLLSGEIGFARGDSGRIGMKIGDGTTAWNSLGYNAGQFVLPGTDVDVSLNTPGQASGVVFAGTSIGTGRFRGKATVGKQLGGLAFGYAGTDGAGTADILLGLLSGPYPAGSGLGVVGGYAYANTLGTSKLQVSGTGIAVGAVSSAGGGEASITARYGWAGGYAAYWDDQGGVLNTHIEADFNGFAFGYAVFGGLIYAECGIAVGKAYGPGTVIEADYGAAFGHAYSGTDTTQTPQAEIHSTGNGSLAFGYVNAEQTGAVALIDALDNGAFAGGKAKALAPYSATISAGAMGSVALGYVYATAANDTISAAANGSMQFGPGTNNLAQSAQFGRSLRLKFETGPPGAPGDGDIWMNAGYIYAHTGGVTGKVQVA